TMSTRFVVPEVSSIVSLLDVVIGPGLTASEGNGGGADDFHVATYIDDNDQLVAVGAADPAFVFYAGAALSMIPAAAANDMLSEGPPNETIAANFYEVMNICSRLLMTEKDDVHLRLDKTLSGAEAQSATAALASATQVSFDLKVLQYGAGKLMFAVT
ncbi:MAG: hypothetical protein AAGJ86_12035, partial [Pseudomonadota bacterium]